MPTTAVFDNATLADAVAKAARIAPNKGEGFDKAAGIQIEVSIPQRSARIRATNLYVTFESDIEILEGKGEDACWRIPSVLLSGIMSNLPMGDGASISFIDRGTDKAIRLQSGRTMLKLNMYEGPLGSDMFKWEPTGDFLHAHDLAQRVSQVEWACDAKSQILQGIHIDGEFLVATDTQVMAMVPAQIGVKEPITVPLTTLSSIISGATDCHIGTSEKRVLIALDDHTRVTSVLLEGNYPDIKRAMRDNFTMTLKVHKNGFIETLDRLLVLARVEKLPALRVEINGTGLVSILTLDLDIPDVGRMMDSIDVETEFDDMFELFFTPAKIQKAVTNCKSDWFYMDLGHPDEKKAPLSLVQIRDEKSYMSCVMPRKQ